MGRMLKSHRFKFLQYSQCVFDCSVLLLVLLCNLLSSNSLSHVIFAQNFDGGVKETSCTYSEPLCVNEERARFSSVSETNVVKTFGVSRTPVIRTAWEEQCLCAGRLYDLNLYKLY